MENSFTLRPLSKQAFHIAAPEQSHPRLSLRRVLYVKFLRWVEKSSASALIKATMKCLTLLAFLAAISVPHFALGILTGAFQFPLFSRVIVYCAGLALMLNAKPLYRLARRAFVRTEKSNGKGTYQGIPLDGFVSYIFERGAFATAAIADLGLSQRKWAKIADELEAHKILVRGDNNARVLSEHIDRPTLVRQLRDGFPLVFDPVGNTWAERRGSFDQWVLAKERKEAKEQEQGERLERKTEKMRENIKRLREEASTFDTVMAMARA